ncbi:MAG: alpha-amylase family glycosyl hydrolase [archaeon]
MTKKIIIIGIVLLILISFVFIKHRIMQESIVSQEDPCADVSIIYKSKCNELNTWLDQRILEWKPAEYKPMNFGVYHVYASDNIFVKSNADFDIKMLDAIEGVNPDTVVLYIRPGSYLSQKERYDALINRIRKDGKKLFIGARFDDVKMDFNGYGNALENYTKSIIAAVKPDYFGIVMEPMTMEQMYNFDATDEQWAALVDRIAKLSKQLSPATKTVADGHKEELNFLKMSSGLESVDIIGFNIYGTEGIYPGYSGYLGKGDVVGNSIDFANEKGKETWILETWTSANIGAFQTSMSVQEFMKPIDAKWVRVLTYYAQRHNMKAIVPFYTGKFVYYGTDPKELQSTVDAGERTLVFYEYQAIIEEASGIASRQNAADAAISDIKQDALINKSWLNEGPIYNVNIANFNSDRTYSELASLIPTIKALGIKTIYLAPIWNSLETSQYKTSGYSILDYSQLNPDYGTESELKSLVNTVHANDMKIIFDLVISYRPAESADYQKHPEWFLHYPDDKIYLWRWGYSTDQTSPGFIENISDTAKYYVQNLGIDGWRVDAPQKNIKSGDESRILLGNGKQIPSNYGATELVREVKRKISSVNPDAILYLEMPGPLCETDPLDCDTSFDEFGEASYNWYFSGWLDYPTRIPVGLITYKNGFLDKVVTNKATSDDLVNYLLPGNIKYNRARSHFSENHDTQRVQMVYPSQNKNLLVMISTIPGVPMIRAGQEIGEIAKKSVDLSRYDTDSDLWKFYSKVFHIRNNSPALKYGGIKDVWKGKDNVYSYSRTYENETVIVVINFGDMQTTSILDIPFKKGDMLEDELSKESFTITDAADFQISVPAYGSRILSLKE